MIAVLGLAGLVGVLVWLWCGHRDPLLHLVPFALAFPPLIVYGGRVLGWPGQWLSTRIALVGCICIWLMFRLLRRDFSYYRMPHVTYVAPYAALVAVSALWSIAGHYNGDAATIGNELLGWSIPMVAFFILVTTRHGEADLKRASRVVVGVAVGVAIYSGLQALVLTGNEHLVPSGVAELTQYGREDLWFGSFRLYGTFPNLGPNFLGAFLLFPAVLAFSRVLSRGGVARAAWLVATLAVVAAIVGTYSRGAMLALGISLIALPLWRRSAQGVMVMICAVGVTVFLAAQTPIGRYAGSLYSDGRLDVSGSARVALWRAILKSTADHPMGLGFNGWPRASRVSADVGLLDSPESLGAPHPAENQWMRELADRGVAGILALALVMAGIIRATFRAADPGRSSGYARDVLTAAGAACVGWVCVMFTGDHLMYDSVAGIFWYMAALSLAAMRDTVEPDARQHGDLAERAAVTG
jgi:O-antigen ligase/polysaccharide polymerase Wzy-like membrane protein